MILVNISFASENLQRFLVLESLIIYFIVILPIQLVNNILNHIRIK